jgi:WD40 repeat protein
VWTPDGAYTATCADDASIRLWDARSGRLVRTFNGHASSVRTLAFSRDGKLLVSGGTDNSVRLWRLADGVLLQTATASSGGGHSGDVLALAASPVEDVVASGSADKSIKIWSLPGLRLLRTLTASSPTAVYSLSFSRTGRYLAESGPAGTVRVWDWKQTAAAPRAFQKHSATSSVLSVAFSPAADHLASGGTDNKVCVWSLANGQDIRPALSFSFDVDVVAFSPDETLLGIGTGKDQTGLLRLSTGASLLLRGHTASVTALCFSPTTGLVATGGQDNRLLVWSARDGSLVSAPTVQMDYVSDIALSADGRYRRQRRDGQ